MQIGPTHDVVVLNRCSIDGVRCSISAVVSARHSSASLVKSWAIFAHEVACNAPAEDRAPRLEPKIDALEHHTVRAGKSELRTVSKVYSVGRPLSFDWHGHLRIPSCIAQIPNAIQDDGVLAQSRTSSGRYVWAVTLNRHAAHPGEGLEEPYIHEVASSI